MKKQKTADAAFLEQQRKRLTAMRNEILGASANKPILGSGDAHEREDDAQNMTQSDIDGAIDAVEDQRLRRIDRALAKIDEGTYGLSVLSGDPIPKARLEAMPDALFTIEEEEARERQQRQ